MDAAITYDRPVVASKWNKQDTLWVLGIYGCAVSSGSLFWPISLGLSGFWSMLILSALAFPITYFTYRAFARFIQSASATNGREGNIVDAVEEHLGLKWAKWLTLLYFITVFPAMMVYTITITNTIIDYVNTQLHLGIMPRYVVAPLATLALVLLVQGNTTFIVKIMGAIVFPFIISLIFFGIMAIPSWNLSYMETAKDFGGLSGLSASVWSSLPMVIYAFSFTSIVSSFVVAQKKAYGDSAAFKVRQIMLVAVVMIIVTVVFFSWSCIFALSPAELADAKANNLTALSYLARKFDNPWLATASQLIVFSATIKSFLAHFLATKESAKGFATSCLGLKPAIVHGKGLQRVLTVMIFVVTCIPAILNWNVLNLIQVVMVPISVFIVYFLPQYAFAKVPCLQKFRGGFANWFSVSIGFICLINGLILAFK
ncbi:serine/threonine transporter [Pseudomonas putida]|nr:serine/threonine transporter [Pseudomonas putida]